MPRINEIAEELKLSTDEVRTRLSAIGEKVDRDSSEVRSDNVERLRIEVGGAEGAPVPVEGAEVTATENEVPDEVVTGDAAAKSREPEMAPEGSVAAEPAPPVASPQPPATTKVEKKQPLRRLLKT